MGYSDNIQSQALRSLEARLPQGWRLRKGDVKRSDGDSDGVLELKAPDGQKTRLLVEVKKQLEPRGVSALAGLLEARRSHTRNTLPLVVSPFLTSRARQLLKEAELSFLDLTGNCWIVSSAPGLFISTSGQETHPQPEDRPVRSLKGPVSGRIVRALCDFLPPVGVRELATRANADPGYVSRLLSVLDREALIVRGSRGIVSEVRWQDLIRKWAEDYSPFIPERVYSALEPRGLDAFSDKIRRFPNRYALTGSMAASAVAPVAPARLAMCYVDDPEQAASQLGLRPAEAGVNVMLLTPFDDVVYERTRDQNKTTFAALSQVAADLLHSPGRGPEEAAALLEWMAGNEHAWRS